MVEGRDLGGAERCELGVGGGGRGGLGGERGRRTVAPAAVGAGLFAGVDEFQPEAAGEGGRCAVPGLGGDAQLDGVGVADPQRRGAAAYVAVVPLGGAEVGGVVVVGLYVLPAGPGAAAGGAGADLDPAP